MIYLFLGLILMGLIGTGGGYWHGVDVGEKRYAANLAVAQEKVQQQADKLKEEAVQKQADIVAAFDKGRADVQQKVKIVYAKGAQYAANDKALSSPQCVMAPDGLILLNSARGDVMSAAAAVAALGLSDAVAVRAPTAAPVVPATSTHPKPQPIGK